MELKSKTDDYPKGPWGMARGLEAKIEELEAHKGECQDNSERRKINQRLRLMREMLGWCKTRAGYVRPEDA